jgi:hypothetical protein
MFELGAFFAAATGFWIAVYRFFQKRGHGPFVAHFSGAVIGLFAGIAALIAVVPTPEQPVETKVDTTTTIQPTTVPNSSGEVRPATQVAEAPKPIEKEPEPDPGKNDKGADDERDLGITLQELTKRFNADMKKGKMPFRLKPIVDSNTFSTRLNNLILVLGWIAEKSGNVSSVMVMGAGDGTLKSGMNLVIVAAAMFAAAFPEIEKQVLVDNLLEMMKSVQAGNGPAERILNGVKMSYSLSNVTGNTFGIEPVK